MALTDATGADIALEEVFRTSLTEKDTAALKAVSDTNVLR
jgi:hypothetical protein